MMGKCVGRSFLLRHVAQCFHLLKYILPYISFIRTCFLSLRAGCLRHANERTLWQENMLSLNQTISVLENLLPLNHAVYLKCSFLDSLLWGLVRNVGDMLIGRAYYIHD